MPRQKKDAKILNIKLAKEISDQLEQVLANCLNSFISPLFISISIPYKNL